MFVSVIILCSSALISDCGIAQNTKDLFKTEEACYQAAAPLVDLASKKNLSLTVYCVSTLGQTL